MDANFAFKHHTCLISINFIHLFFCFHSCMFSILIHFDTLNVGFVGKGGNFFFSLLSSGTKGPMTFAFTHKEISPLSVCWQNLAEFSRIWLNLAEFGRIWPLPKRGLTTNQRTVGRRVAQHATKKEYLYITSFLHSC